MHEVGIMRLLFALLIKRYQSDIIKFPSQSIGNVLRFDNNRDESFKRRYVVQGSTINTTKAHV